MGKEGESGEMRGKAGGQRRRWIRFGLSEEEGGRKRRKRWLFFKEQETRREHLTHMISIKGRATCR